MTDEEILKEVDHIADGLAYDIREYAKAAVKHLRSVKHPNSRSRSFIDYVGADQISRPIVAAALAEVATSYTAYESNSWTVKTIRHIFDAEEDKS